jgi:hypothetical protein
LTSATGCEKFSLLRLMNLRVCGPQHFLCGDSCPRQARETQATSGLNPQERQVNVPKLGLALRSESLRLWRRQAHRDSTRVDRVTQGVGGSGAAVR